MIQLSVYKVVKTVLSIIGPIITILALGSIYQLTLGDVWMTLRGWGPRLLTLKIGWAILLMLGVYFTYLGWARGDVVLTVLDLAVSVRLDAADGSIATVQRTQTIAAHRDDVTGYLRKIVVSGQMPREKFQAHIDHCKVEEQRTQFDKMPNGWELIHSFDKPIPVDLLRTGLTRVTRTEKFVAINSLTEEEETYEVEVHDQYRYRHLTLKLEFHPDRPRSKYEVNAIRINAMGVIKLPIVPIFEGAGEGVLLKVKRPRAGDRYRLVWKRLPAPVAGSASPVNRPR